MEFITNEDMIFLFRKSLILCMTIQLRPCQRRVNFQKFCHTKTDAKNSLGFCCYFHSVHKHYYMWADPHLQTLSLKYIYIYIDIYHCDSFTINLYLHISLQKIKGGMIHGIQKLKWTNHELFTHKLTNARCAVKFHGETAFSIHCVTNQCIVDR